MTFKVLDKVSGVRRYIIEDDRGVLHIYSDKNLKLFNTDTDRPYDSQR